MSYKICVYSREEILSELGISSGQLAMMFRYIGNDGMTITEGGLTVTVDLPAVLNCSHKEISEPLRYYAADRRFGLSQDDLIAQDSSEQSFWFGTDLEYILFFKDVILIFDTRDTVERFVGWVEFVNQPKMA